MSRLLFLGLAAQVSWLTGEPALLAAASFASSNCAFSAASRCSRKSSSCSAVSFRTAASFARVDSSTESRKSTSSSSRLLNWFLSRAASSNASCLAATCRTNLACQMLSVCGWIENLPDLPLFCCSTSYRLLLSSCLLGVASLLLLCATSCWALTHASSGLVGAAASEPAGTKPEDIAHVRLNSTWEKVASGGLFNSAAAVRCI